MLGVDSEFHGRGYGDKLARLERAAEALEADPKPNELERLRQDMRGWSNTALRYLDALAPRAGEGGEPLARSLARGSR
jgi:hypothetical protein